MLIAEHTDHRLASISTHYRHVWVEQPEQAILVDDSSSKESLGPFAFSAPIVFHLGDDDARGLTYQRAGSAVSSLQRLGNLPRRT